MRRALLAGAAFAALALSACSDVTYDAIPGTKPVKVVVIDENGRADHHATAKACAMLGRRTINVQYTSYENALVTCSEAGR